MVECTECYRRLDSWNDLSEEWEEDDVVIRSYKCPYCGHSFNIEVEE